MTERFVPGGGGARPPPRLWFEAYRELLDTVEVNDATVAFHGLVLEAGAGIIVPRLWTVAQSAWAEEWAATVPPGRSWSCAPAAAASASTPQHALALCRHDSSRATRVRTALDQ